MINVFIESHDKQSLIFDVSEMIKSSVDKDETPLDLMEKVNDKVIELEIEKDFNTFVELQGERDKTWKFWNDFIFTNCFAYVTLYLSMSGSNWNLRNASLHSMGAVFFAMDRDCYQRIIATHLADINILPQQILDFFLQEVLQCI